MPSGSTRVRFLLGILLTTFMATGVFAKNHSNAKTALLLVAHGSHSDDWNQTLLTVGEEVKALALADEANPFDDVQMAFLEFTEPSIFSVVNNLDNAGVERVLVMPVFVAPSGHSMRDLPAALGIYADQEICQTMAEENIRIPETDLHFVLGPTLFPGDLIKEITLERVRTLSTNPEDEAVVIMAHGDDYFGKYWQNMVNQTGEYICGKTGLESCEGAFIHIGQRFTSDGLEAIESALKLKKTVLVANLFMAMDLEKLANASKQNFMGTHVPVKILLRGKDIRYCDALAPHPKIAAYLWKQSCIITKTSAFHN